MCPGNADWDNEHIDNPYVLAPLTSAPEPLGEWRPAVQWSEGGDYRAGDIVWTLPEVSGAGADELYYPGGEYRAREASGPNTRNPAGRQGFVGAKLPRAHDAGPGRYWDKLSPYLDRTIQSQYSASHSIVELIRGFRQLVNPGADIQSFFHNIFNIHTASGFGLDIWGRIVAIPRRVRATWDEYFGFDVQALANWQPFDEGPFFEVFPAGSDSLLTAGAGALYTLGDDAYRDLIFWKALSNISTADAARINELLGMLFGGSDIFVLDLGTMAIRLVVAFPLTAAQRALLRDYGLTCRGAGVGFQLLEAAPPIFGFATESRGEARLSSVYLSPDIYSEANIYGIYQEAPILPSAWHPFGDGTGEVGHGGVFGQSVYVDTDNY